MESSIKKRVSATDYLANERTFLAWIRTGIAIMAFGFVVVKFSLFINQIAFLVNDSIKLPDARFSYWIGIGLVILGTLLSILAFVRFRQADRQLAEDRYQSGFILSLLLTCCLIIVGILMIVYLLS